MLNIRSIGLGTLAAFVACNIACSADEPTLPNAAGSKGVDAATPDAALRDADFGNRNPSDATNVQPPESQGGPSREDPCETGAARGAGVMSGLLEGTTPVLTPTTTLDRFVGAGPAVLQGMSLPSPIRLALRDGGLLATSEAGFFDVGPDRAARFHIVRSAGVPPTVLPTDLDGDGDEDLLSITLMLRVDRIEPNSSLMSPVLAVWEREADGRLERRTLLEAEHRGLEVVFALADYDGDDDDDLVTFDERGTLIALRNEGAFAFSEVVLRERETALFGALAIVAEDRNADGAADLVVVGESETSSPQLEARVLLNDGAGNFHAPTVSALATYVEPMEPRFGDVTGDGFSDLVLLSNDDPEPTIRVAQSLDAGDFADFVQLMPVSYGVVLADVDGDGVLDIASYSPGTLTVLRARGGLEFDPITFELATDWLNAIAIEGGSAAQPARLHALYHATCRFACGEGCALGCFFEACLECLAHSACDEGKACVSGVCTAR
jgi:hypothetical protein